MKQYEADVALLKIMHPPLRHSHKNPAVIDVASWER
jgi:hypothetical protein